MKVLFRFSPRGDIKRAKDISDNIKNLGHKLTCDFVKTVTDSNFYVDTDDVWAKRYISCKHEITSADVCVIEASIPSTAMGQIATLSIEKDKPTIILYYGKKAPYFFRGLIKTNPKVQLLEYSDSDLQMVLKYAFDVVSQQINTRFTLLLPPEIISFLNKKRKYQGISSSDFIRSLIKREITQN